MLDLMATQRRPHRRAGRLDDRGHAGVSVAARGAPDGRGDETSQYRLLADAARSPDWDVLNRGVNGERSDQIAARFERDVIARAPAVVVIIAGVNDVYQGRAGGHVIGAAARDVRPRRRTAGHPRRRRHDRSLQHGDRRPERADARDQRLDPDQRRGEPRSPFADTRAAVAAPGNPDRLAESPDGLHPSPPGYRRMADAIRPVLDRALRGIL